MAKKEERFEVTFRDGSQLKDEGVRQILVDKETGVNYLCWKSGYGAAITPLLDSEGKSVVMEVKNVFHRRKRLYYANDKRNGKSIIFFNVWEKVCFC